MFSICKKKKKKTLKENDQGSFIGSYEFTIKFQNNFDHFDRNIKSHHGRIAVFFSVTVTALKLILQPHGKVKQSYFSVFNNMMLRKLSSYILPTVFF